MRRRWGGLLALVFVLGGCSSEGASIAATASASDPASATRDGSWAAGSVTPAASASPSLVGGAASPTLVTSSALPSATQPPSASAATTSSSGSSPASPTASGAQPVGATIQATVTRVVDGDTIEVSIAGKLYKVRYIGVDTPETVKPNTPVQWMGPEASAANKQLVAARTVVLEKDVSETDQYGRLLRYVWLHDASGWTMVNERLVELGYAQVSTWPPDVRYVDVFLGAQARARDAEVGLWGPEPATTPPPVATPPPTPQPTPRPTLAPTKPPVRSNCDPSYPTVCIPPAPPDLNCGDIPYRRFKVLPPDPHHFDGDHDGIGCESN